MYTYIRQREQLVPKPKDELCLACLEDQKGSQWPRNGRNERAIGGTRGTRDIMGHLVVVAETPALTQGTKGLKSRFSKR